jgi:eukaryotic-like serine/threonine-protein kinase
MSPAWLAGPPYTPSVDTTLQDPLVGQQLDGRYLVRSRIARGGMATVYLALDQRLQRDVALKVMHAHLADDEQFTARFVREARAAARLSQPNVVQVYDQGADGDLLYLAMEYLRGRTLRDVLAERGVLTAREALTVAEPVLDALAAAHRQGIVHRDVKPENVILTDDGRVKVADFGLARAATANTSTTGVLMGTVAYLAPELVLRGVSDARSDVYAAGIMLFEMLTGRQPFSGEVPIQVAYQHVNEQVPAPSRFVPGLPAALDELVAGATARDPDDRAADAGELLTRLRAVRAELTPAQLDARPEQPPATGGEERVSPRATAALTEVVETRRAPQHTQALPLDPATLDSTGSRQVTAHTGVVAARQVAGPTAGPPQSELATQPGPEGTEDAALAALLRRRRVTGIVALLVVVGLAVTLAGSAWYFAAGPGAYTTTPDVVGRQASQASDALAAQGLRSTQTQVFATAATGVVVSTDPSPGRPVRKDGAVDLRVSKGPARVTVPAVAGLKEDAAQAALTQAHLAVGDSQQVFNDRPQGEVVSSDPAAGQTVPNGSGVTLTVSKGPQPVAVPDLTGQSQAQAERALRALRLGWSYGPALNDDTAPAGSVLSQNPSNGTLLPGQAVALVLSKGPVLVTVPNVVGQQVQQARATLESAGFNVTRNNILGGFFGTVRAQNPPGGSTAPKGSTITLTVV